MKRRLARLTVIPLLLLAFGVTMVAGAVEGVQLALARLIAPWGTLEGVDLRLEGVSVEGARLALDVERIVLNGPLRAAAFSLRCPGFSLETERIRCPAGTLSLGEGPLGPLRLAISFEFQPASGGGSVALRGERFAGGRLDLHLERDDELHWRARGALAGAQLEQLISSAKGLRPELDGWAARGAGDLRFRLAGRGPVVEALSLDGGISAAAVESPDGRLATAGLEAAFQLHSELRKEDRESSGEISLQRGELYADPLYWQAAERPTVIGFELLQGTRDGAAQINVKRITVDDPGTVKGSGEGVLTERQGEWRLLRMDANLEQVVAGAAYRRYLQPLLGGGQPPLEVEGRLAGALSWRGSGGVADAELRIDHLFIDDPAGRFGLYDLDGTLGWSGSDRSRDSDLTWQGGHFLALDLGASGLHARSRQGRLALREAMEQPLLDGRLLVDSVELTLAPDGAVGWDLDAVLTPVSMGRLSEALGWPRMNGRLSGVIPRLGYHDGVMSVGGDLLARLFDGEVLIRGLRLEHPFGPLCRVDAEVQAHRLDLDELTRTFSFGSIQGRLDGEVTGLRLVQWKPVAFDAWFSTPKDDDSRHRISQKAVENLSKVGGGAMGGALSRGLLGLFEQFGYDRIGIGCRLRDGVCRMRGVAPHDGGYYLVKGGGLPRIDVIGYARDVDWDELIARLRSVTLENPEIR
ncbi:translocation/assembly module TamB domain-containing protein [Endothiovibrio diazotrophicus]